MTNNAGLRLWNTQRAQGTGLCVGLDPHYDPNGEINEAFFASFADLNRERQNDFRALARILNSTTGLYDAFADPVRAADFFAGVTNYFEIIATTAWHAGIRVFKPQSSFFERFVHFMSIVEVSLLNHITAHARTSKENAFLIRDGKPEDLLDSQAPRYVTYLSTPGQEVVPGMNGQHDYDTMTVTAWMGREVILPGLAIFRAGKGCIVVTQSSNPSGTFLQDAVATPPTEGRLASLSEKQRQYCLTQERISEVAALIERAPTNADMLLDETARISSENGLDQDEVSPLFSVMGSTVKFDGAFRKIRPGGIALVPGFGAQGGQFANVMPLVATEGPLAGHIGILSSSRAHAFPWSKKYGGQGKYDVENVKTEVARAIDQFRADERQAYIDAGLTYPF